MTFSATDCSPPTEPAQAHWIVVTPATPGNPPEDVTITIWLAPCSAFDAGGFAAVELIAAANVPPLPVIRFSIAVTVAKRNAVEPLILTVTSAYETLAAANAA